LCETKEKFNDFFEKFNGLVLEARILVPLGFEPY
jgi:hypothetical protein